MVEVPKLREVKSELQAEEPTNNKFLKSQDSILRRLISIGIGSGMLFVCPGNALKISVKSDLTKQTESATVSILSKSSSDIL